MRGMISGNAVRCQVGKEGADTYGTAATMQRQIKIVSEDFKYTPTKKQEGVLTGNIGASSFQSMGIRTENSLSFLARPDDLGIFLNAVFGVESVTAETGDSTGVYTHVFTPLGNSLTDYLPSLTFKFDKKVGIFVYTGCKINSLSFSAAQEDFLNVDLELFGKDEVKESTALGVLTPSVLKAFTFNGGKVYLAGEAMADITSIDFSYNNNLENTLQTTSTGLYYKEPQPNTREITLDLEMLYGTDAETWREDWFKTDDMLSVKLEFKNRELMIDGNPYTLTIEIPAAQCTECSMAVGDANGIRQSASLVGIDNSVDTLITATLKNAVTTAY